MEEPGRRPRRQVWHYPHRNLAEAVAAPVRTDLLLVLGCQHHSLVDNCSHMPVAVAVRPLAGPFVRSTAAVHPSYSDQRGTTS